MSNKFTIMVALATAMLLSGPVQAQDFTKKHRAPKTKVMKLLNGQSTTATLAKAEFRQQQEQQRQAKRNVEKVRSKGRPFRNALTQTTAEAAASTAKGVKTPLRAERQVFKPFSFNASSPLKTFRANGEIADEHGIILTPAEGTRQVYTRSGWKLTNDEGVQQSEQTGTVHLVECEDGTVYVRNILASYPTGAWVKGQREGNTITIPARQPIYFNSLANITYSPGWVYAEDSWGSMSYSLYSNDSFVFTVDDDAQTITLQNSSETLFIGLLWDDDDSFAWHGDWQSVWTYQGVFEPLPTVEVSAPDGLSTETWYSRGHIRMQESTQIAKGTVAVGFVGNDIYLKGLFADYPEAWMKGTLSDGVVTFSGLQTLGTKDDQPVYAVGSVSGDLVALTMTYDADQKVLEATTELLANQSTTDINAAVWYNDLTISLADPYAPIETLPYQNAISSIADFEWFNVIDANGDGSTWQYYDQQASYKYNSDNNADDWLITPGIRMEAGKTYSFAIDACTSSIAYAERIEVKLGNAVAPEAMTTEVIAATDIETETGITLENKLITVSETGVYYFGIHAISEADRASLRVRNLVVGETILTAPAAVTDLTVTADAENPIATLKFTAPSKNIGGDYLTGNITRIDVLRDGEVAGSLNDVTPGTQQTYVDNDASLQAGDHTYQVIGYNTDGKGDASNKATVHLIQALDIPYYGDFAEDDTYNQFTVLDANGDYFTWEDNSPHAAYTYNTDQAADDYLIAPPLHMEAGKSYVITVNAGSGGYPERFDIVAGEQPTVEGLSTKVLENCEVTMEDAKDFEGIFTAEKTGVYYVAVHCISDADQYELWVNKLSVEAAPEPTSPSAPTIQLEVGQKGDLSAVVRVTAPTLAYDGTTTLTDDVTLEVYRNGELLTTRTAAPGAVVRIPEFDLPAAGIYAYQAIPYNASGKGVKSDIVRSYIGIDTPLAVENIQAKDQLSSVLLSWDKVGETGVNDGYVNTADVTYNIYACDPGSTWVDTSDGPTASVKDANQCQLDYNTNEGDQTYQAWVVTASNEAGESYMNNSLTTLLVGAPYELPFVEGFANGRTHHYWDSNAMSLTFTQATDGDGSAIALTSQQPGDIFLTSGKLNVNGAQNPVLFFDAAGFGVSTVNMVGLVNGSQTVDLGSAQVTNTGYTRIKVPLTSLKSTEGYAQFALMANIANPTILDEWGESIQQEGDAFILDNVRVVDLYQHNLAVELQAPVVLQAGRKATVTADVTNWGEQAAKNFTVTITCGNHTLLEQTVSEPLPMFETLQFTAELETTVFDDGFKTIDVKVDYAQEEKDADNSATTDIALTNPIVLPPTDLVAVDNGSTGVDLSWTAPQGSAMYVEQFDDTEVFPTFSTGGITATEHNGTLGEWTLYDATGAGVYGWNGVDFPNQYAPAAWMPFDFQKAGFNGISGISGTQVMLSMCPEVNESGEAPAADHWLISPELPGYEQTIAFYLMPIATQYGEETVEVLASSTDNKPESFTTVETVSASMQNWEHYTVTLPEGTKYFALRHVSHDVFGVFLDDITFDYVGKVAKYNVYFLGERIATVEGSQTTYLATSDQLTTGKRMTFDVTAVYANGNESLPATTSIAVVTDIRDIVADGQPVDVYTLDGRLLRSRTTTLAGLKGIYVINGKTVLVK